jgi:hypothetical protein
MLGFGGKKKQVKSTSEKAANKIAGGLLKMQLAFSRTMNKRFDGMSAKRSKAVLILFCVLWGSASLYFIVLGVLSKPSQTISIEQANTPAYFNKMGNIEDDVVTVDETTWNNIQTFKKYMDSLKFYQPASYDSILSSRPGLLDSIEMIESIYYSQQIK